MEHEKVWQEFVSLPPEGQHQVAAFITALRERYARERPPSPRARASAGRAGIAEEEFIGIWRDRPEMGDSSTWVRGVREREWARSSD